MEVARSTRRTLPAPLRHEACCSSIFFSAFSVPHTIDTQDSKIKNFKVYPEVVTKKSKHTDELLLLGTQMAGTELCCNRGTFRNLNPLGFTPVKLLCIFPSTCSQLCCTEHTYSISASALADLKATEFSPQPWPALQSLHEQVFRSPIPADLRSLPLGEEGIASP